jgi:succinate dehydrogenase / fumarate reductase membrane anchor subunit
MRMFQLQRLSAVALLVFLTVHMVVVHYPPFHIDFSRILERMADPLWKAIDVAFLFVVLVHALAGSYAVLTDLESVGRARRALAGAAILVGLVAFYYGTATILAFQPPA